MMPKIYCENKEIKLSTKIDKTGPPTFLKWISENYSGPCETSKIEFFKGPMERGLNFFSWWEGTYLHSFFVASQELV